ncbi:MAG: type IV secretion system DNA-binding domain-containing protein [Candidatus Magasanikbacteria bacterium]|nr:type IV secretion system DNA-binding domain-containing protein [Candidatus Magasanikbacteria bacterium]
MSDLVSEENKPVPDNSIGNPDVNFFGLANYRNQNRKFGIKLDDRRRHMYVVGKTGMGKTTLLENMVLNDIYAGHGLGYVDPHGDTAEKILNYIPANRINDVVYFNPSDLDYPIGFNILETIRPDQKHLVASGLMGVFKKIWPDVWSSRMEYILNNTILALLDFPGTTLLGINRLLADEEYRRRVVNNTQDPVIKAFWQTEFASYNDKYKQEAVAPIQNKIGQFLSASVIRNIVAQVKSRINIREIMDEKKIFIMNLSKGRIGEDNSRLLGGMLITKIQLSAMERVDTPEAQRKDFFLYVDEFQNFATESFANILSEARKYRLDLTMAHQYMEQLEEEVLAAVIGNVGTIVTFRVGSSDAEILAKEFIPTFVEEDLINLPKFHIYLKLMIDGVASRPFSALTMAPIAQATGSMEKVIKVSRERYAVNREKIEDKIARWSGMVIIPGDEASELDVDEEDAMFAPAAKPVQKVVTPAPPVPPAPKPIVKPPVVATVPQPAVIIPPTNNPPSFARPQQPSQPGQPGSGKRNRHRNKGGGKGGQNFGNPNQSAPVAIVDTAQKGISLSALQPPQSKPIQPEPPKSVSTPAPLSLDDNKLQASPVVAVKEEKPVRVYAMPYIPTPQPTPPQDQKLKTLKSGQVDKIDE